MQNVIYILTIKIFTEYSVRSLKNTAASTLVKFIICLNTGIFLHLICTQQTCIWLISPQYVTVASVSHWHIENVDILIRSPPRKL